MIVALMLGMAATAFTGYLLTTDAFWGVAWMQHLHDWSAHGLILLVGVHLAGVALASFRHRENLVHAMIVGRKRAAGSRGRRLTAAAACAPPAAVGKPARYPRQRDSRHARQEARHPHRDRFLRADRGPRRPLLGRAIGALAGELPDRLGEAAGADRARPRHHQARRGRSEHGPRQARPEGRRSHRQGGAGSRRRQARRAFPAGRLADRLGHAVQHERQRGDRQPRHRDPRRRHRLEDAGPSQRPRQHEPVVQRHLPDGHAHRLRRGDRAPPAPGAAEAAQRAQRQGARLRQDHQDRPHPHPGRHAADARPGVLRLHPAGRERHRPHRADHAGPDAARPGRHRRRHRPQCPGRLRRAHRRPHRRAHRHEVHLGAEQVRGARRPRRHGLLPRRHQHGGGEPVQDRATTSASSPPARAPASANCRCPRTSPARRSCPARSTRPSARR